MIIFKEKIFRRDEFTDNNKILPDPDIEKTVGKLKIRISTEKKYENDTQKLGLKGTPNRQRLEDLKDSIRKGYLTVDGNYSEENSFSW